jgi:hypothetical protein
MGTPTQKTVALVWRGSAEARQKAAAQTGRLGPLFDAMTAAGLTAVPAVYCDELASEVREQLLGVDGVLVWVDPAAPDGDRSKLDPLLREVASSGVLVSAHPDVILAMGTKEVLVRTKSLGWGSDCHLYRTVEAMRSELPRRLASGATRVLKQYRGNGGNGVYRVELQQPAASRDATAPPGLDSLVHSQHARFGSAPKDMTLGEFMTRLEKHFEGDGRLIDQPFQQRLADGMIRCYMVRNEVVGYGQQLIKALLPPPPEGLDSPAALPGPRIMHGAEAPEFQRLRVPLETEWIPGMQTLLDVPTERLPLIWDADFLYGPKTATGEDTYVLCEINVSAVFPFPDQALPKLAQAAASAISAATQARVAAARA